MTVLFEHRLEVYKFSRDALESLPDLPDPELTAACNAFCAAEDDVVRTKAETLDQLVTKAEIMWQDAHAEPDRPDILAFCAELRRLAGCGPSRIFNPTRWLDRFQKAGGGWIDRGGEIVLLVAEDDGHDDLLHELEVCAGRNAVLELIRERRSESLVPAEAAGDD